MPRQGRNKHISADVNIGKRAARNRHATPRQIGRNGHQRYTSDVPDYINMTVGNRTTLPQGQRSNTGPVPEFQQWITHVVVNACTNLYLDFGNYDSACNPGPSALTLRVGRKANNTTTGTNGLWASNGAIDSTIAPGAKDTVVFPGNFTAGQKVYFVVKATYAVAPTNWPVYSIDGVSNDNVNETGTGLTDKTTLNSIIGSRAVPDALIRPFNIRGDVVTVPATPYRAMILGDSISSNGQADLTNIINGVNYQGYAMRALADVYPWSTNGYSGLPLSVVAGENPAHQAVRNAALVDGKFTHVIILAVTNDLVACTNDAQCDAVKANVDLLVARYTALNVKVIVSTSPPRTNAGNTAAASYGTGAGRIRYNNLIRAAYPGRVLDIAPIFEDAVDPTLWRTDLSGGAPPDGTHPTKAMHDVATPYTTSQLPTLLAA